MQIETDADLKRYNTFGFSALAPLLIHIQCEADLIRIVHHPEYRQAPKLVLGGGSNIVLHGPVPAIVLKVEIMGRRLIQEQEDAWIVEAGAGENWHELVTWTIANGWGGLENLALIPGTVGAAPIQNIGAYGIEFKERLLSLDAMDLTTGRCFCLSAPTCRFDYRHSIFKDELAGQCIITRVRLRLPKPWRAVLDYPDLRCLREESGGRPPDARQVCECVCNARRAKLPDPATLGNAGSFFKNPVVDRKQFAVISACAPDMAHHPLPDGTVKLSAGWMIEACGWKGKRMGNVGVHDRQALVLVNHGGAAAHELMELAGAIRESVCTRFGVRLEIEPIVI